MAAGARAAATRHHDRPDVSQLNDRLIAVQTPVLHHDLYVRAAGNAGDRVRGEDSGRPICFLRIKGRLGRNKRGPERSREDPGLHAGPDGREPK